MKKLTKIKLINWYTFFNNTIEISGNTLISGENGSGKSTLLDAIQYVLTAGNAKFNKAADEKSTRTLESYVRGKTGVEDKEYIRNGDVTSYVCLEFFDDETKRYDLIGTVISYPSGGKLNREFFKITGMGINDSLFTVNKMIKTINEFKKEKYVETFDTKNKASQMIKSVLGLRSDKYFELITKALAYKPINKLDSFVYDFLLPEDKINLESLQNNINSLNELHKIIQEEELKIKNLEIIEENHNKHISIIKEGLRLNYLKKYLEILEKDKLINKNNELLNKENQNLSNIEKELENMEIKINKLKDDLSLYDKSIGNNKDFDLYKELDNLVKKLKEQNKALIDKKNQYVKLLKKEINLLKDFSWLKIIDLLKNQDNIKEMLLKHQKNIEEEKNKNIKELQEFKDRKDKINIEIEKASDKLKYLNKGTLPYDYKVILLRDTIKEKLSLKYNTKIEIRPVCEYLRILDDSYRNAIEGYLNNQRFDLIIEPKYFNDAVSIYDELKKENRIYGIGIVNTTKLVDIEVSENTLATLVTSDNPYARRYMLKLLNGVYLAKSSLDLKNYKKAITKDCMVYSNHVIRKINPKYYDDKFIGEVAKKEQIAKYKLVYDSNQSLLIEVNEMIKKLEYQKDKLLNSNIIELRKEENIFNELDINIKELDSKLVTLKEYENNRLLFDIIEKRKIIEINLNNINSEKDKKIEHKALIINKIEELDKNIELLKNEKEKLEVNLPNKEEGWNIESENLSNIDSKINDNEKKEITLSVTINNLLEKYNIEFECDEIPIIENIDKYMNILYKSRESKLLDYKNKATELKESCLRSFKEDFIMNLKDKIENAKEEIRILNKGLKMHVFGREVYEFIIKKSDNQEFSKYYDIITSGADFLGNTLFSDTLSNEQYDELEGLFYKLMYSDTLEKQQKIVDEYTDYRRYLSYDIKITNDEGEVYYFSKVLNEKSGGETQTPFYVIIAASFENLLRFGRRMENIGCVVLFDEAFNNMDEVRIESMMKFYAKELNIQLIISVPSNKISNIVPYVDTTLLISKKNHASSVFRILNTNNYFNEV